jgi:hypothetical protein
MALVKAKGPLGNSMVAGALVLFVMAAVSWWSFHCWRNRVRATAHSAFQLEAGWERFYF